MIVSLLLACTASVGTPAEPGHAPTPDVETGADTAAAPFDGCDGVDDDRDGAIDEDAPDLDGDGVADCLDDDCAVELGDVTAVELDPTCAPVVADPWETKELWSADVVDSWSGAVMTMGLAAKIAFLDADAIPDVLVIPFPWDHAGFAVASLRGSDGRLQWAADGSPGCGLAVVDPLGNGTPLVVTGTFSRDYREIRAFDGETGDAVWLTTVSGDYHEVSDTNCPIAVTDLEGDGRAEVITNLVVLDAETGEVLTRLAPEPEGGSDGISSPARGVTSGDVDGDGVAEVLSGATVYGPSGRVVWRTELAHETWPVLVEADGDAQPEVAILGNRLEVFDGDGTLLATGPSTSGWPGTPAVADVDGDGVSEVVYPDAGWVMAVGVDGVTRWAWPSAVAPSGTSGVVLWDVNADGTPEVLLEGSTGASILEGTTGDEHVLTTFLATVEGGGLEMQVADLDGDGSAELLAALPASVDPAVRAWTHRGDGGWPSSVGLWPSSDWAGDNVDDGGVATAPAHWGDGYRLKPIGDLIGGADLALSLSDQCLASCEPGTAAGHVVVAVRNEGPYASAPDVPVALYAASGQLLAVQTAPGPIASRTSSVGLDFPVDPRGWAASGLRFVVGDPGDGTVLPDCDLADNTLEVTLPACE